jgi:hypothetical protein
MPIIAFHPARSQPGNGEAYNRPMAIEVTTLAAEVLQQMVGPGGGLLTRQHVPVLERLAKSQVRDGDLRMVSTCIDSHETVFVRLL